MELMLEIGISLHVIMMNHLKVVCYNMHGFVNGYSTLSDLCGKFDIIGVEEHWLAPYNLNDIQNFHPDFECFCWSAMSDKIKSGLLKGRPFGVLDYCLESL